jgi:hypothetical protein
VKTFNQLFLKRRFSEMNDNETRNRQKFVRVCDFGEAHASDFAAGTLGQQQFAALAAVVTEIDGHAMSEVSARGDARQGTQTRSQAREALRDALEAINRTARAMADEAPGIENKFRMPRGNNDSQLINVARAFLADATPLKTQFIAHELPADFLEDLQADITALESAISDQSSGVGNHVAASAAIDDAITRGIEIVRKLDAIVRNKYANNPAVLAEWTSASHTERAPRRAPPPSTGPTPTPPPAA